MAQQSMSVALAGFEARLRGALNLAIDMKNYAAATKGLTGSAEIAMAAEKLLKAVQDTDKQIQNVKKYSNR